jgi:hypothetical protein
VPRWFNPPLLVYHGTDTVAIGAGSVSIGQAVRFAVNLARCRPFTDFGQGFYVTTNLHQAREWANAKVERTLAQPTPPSRPQAMVLGFEADRDWLASLEALCFVRPIRDFWDLVHDCRNRYPPHQRVYPYGPYDIVYGPVTIWPSRLLIADCDQISFHTPRSLQGLGANPTIVDAAPANPAEPGDKFP